MKYENDPCPYCKKILGKEFVEKRTIAKGNNARASIKKAMDRGLAGRKLKRNDQEIRQLKNAGFNINEICKLTNLSRSTVSRSINHETV